VNDDMAFAQLRFIRHLPDGLASALVPAPSTVGIGAQHRRFARTLRHINSTDGRSFAPFNHRFAPAHDWLGKTHPHKPSRDRPIGSSPIAWSSQQTTKD
jgi:hypothetical protein